MKKYTLKINVIICSFIFMWILFTPFKSISAMSAVVHIPEKYTDVIAGERLYFELEIKYPENPTRKDLRLTYQILKNNNIVLETKVLKAIETQSSFSDYITIPESIDSGLYEMRVQISDYNVLNESVSANFMVAKKTDQTMMYFFIILGAIVILGIIIILEIKKLKKFL